MATWWEKFWADVRNKVKAWIEDALKWILDQITWLTAQIRIGKHKFKEWLLELWNTEAGFWLIIIATIAIVIGITALSASGALTKISAVVASIKDTLKTWIGGFLDFIRYKDWLIIHQIAQLFWDEYRDAWANITQAVSTLSEELGQGFGTIGAIVVGIQHMAQLAMESVGFSPSEAWTATTVQTQEFFIAANEAFETYALNPNQLLIDLEVKLVRPYQEQYAEQTKKVLGSIDSINTWITNFTGKFNEIVQTVVSITSKLDKDVANAINKRIGEATAYWQQLYDTKITVWQETIAAAVDVVEASIARNDAKLKALEKTTYEAQHPADIILLSSEKARQELGASLSASGLSATSGKYATTWGRLYSGVHPYDTDAQVLAIGGAQVVSKTVTWQKFLGYEAPRANKIGVFVGDY